MNFIIGNNIRLRNATNADNIQVIGGSDMDLDETYNDKTIIQNEAVVISPSSLTVKSGVSLVNNNYTLESGVAVSVNPGKRYFFDGAVPSTWTLDTIANNTGIETWIYNIGTATITVNSNAGANDIYTGGAAANTFNIVAGAWAILFCNGTVIAVII